jgi:quercetin dioxygenase-like cupin family protein
MQYGKKIKKYNIKIGALFLACLFIVSRCNIGITVVVNRAIMEALKNITSATGQPISAANCITTKSVFSKQVKGGTLSVMEIAVKCAAIQQQQSQANDTIINVTEGKFEVIVDGDNYTLLKGACIFIPAGTVFIYKNTGLQNGILLVTSNPCGKGGFLNGLVPMVQVYDSYTMQKLHAA